MEFHFRRKLEKIPTSKCPVLTFSEDFFCFEMTFHCAFLNFVSYIAHNFKKTKLKNVLIDPKQLLKNFLYEGFWNFGVSFQFGMKSNFKIH